MTAETEFVEICGCCLMPRQPESNHKNCFWGDEHEEIIGPRGTQIFCFQAGDTAETFWNCLSSLTTGLERESCTVSAIRNRRSPEWIRRCALEDMESERIVNKRERYERIAYFCKRRAYELAPQLELHPIRPEGFHGRASL